MKKKLEHLKKYALKFIGSKICLVMFVLLGSTVSWSAEFPGINSSSQCAYGGDGSVSCGGQSSQCAYGGSGAVSCGGQSSECAYGGSGAVSCGGQSSECAYGGSGDVSCGGEGQ